METIHTGWLMKSPQVKPWKILKPKWRKRYFVLCISQASTTLPGQCPAILDYYNSEKQSHKRGSIDLNNCDEVQTNVPFPPYEHVFTLRTKHKDHYRTYVLAAENEDDMNRWVQCLCTVLQLNDGSETGTEDSLSELNSAQCVVDERYVRVPQIPAMSPITVPSATVSHSSSLRSSTSPVLPNEFNLPSSLTDEDKTEAYIYLDECYSGKSAASQKMNFHSSDGSTQKTPTGRTSHMKYSPPGMEDPRFDPKRLEYTNLPKGGGSDLTDGWHSAPSYTNNVTAALKNRAGSSAEIGDTKSRALCSSQTASPAETAVAKMPVPNGGKAPSLDSEVVVNKDLEIPSYINLNNVGGVPQSAAARGFKNAGGASSLNSQSLCSSPSNHAISNGTQSSGKQNIGGCRSACLSMSPEGKRELDKSTFAAEDDMEPVLISGRTQSFKRNIIHSDVQLPIKKCGHGADTSSSDDDSSDDDSPLHKSYENEVPVEPPPIPPPPKKSAHTQPKDAIQYLDLNLEESSGAEKSPSINRSQHLPPPETNYNEIDWVRTKALLETKKDLESERHNSEKSAD